MMIKLVGNTSWDQADNCVGELRGRVRLKEDGGVTGCEDTPGMSATNPVSYAGTDTGR